QFGWAESFADVLFFVVLSYYDFDLTHKIYLPGFGFLPVGCARFLAPLRWLGLAFSAPAPRWCKPLTCLSAFVKLLKTLLVCCFSVIQLTSLSVFITGHLGSSSMTSNHLCFPSSPTQ